MVSVPSPLSRQEEIIMTLRSLFHRYGYSRCRVSTFEAYDFYAQNRSALDGEAVLLFTDGDGRLMALRPDVTMSIVKNIPENLPGLQKLCYNENVYRIPTGGTGFRETVQTGLECIGALDSFTLGEVVMIAARSLEAINPQYILDVSHMDLTDGLLDEILSSGQDRAPIFKALEQKNTAALESISQSYGLTQEQKNTLCTLCTVYGTLKTCLEQISPLITGEKAKKAFSSLQALSSILDAYGLSDRVHLDFSIRGGTDYYSGLMLRGSVAGVARPILWGGQYDRLIYKMGKKAGGIGFAVYLDQLERGTRPEQLQKALLLYDSSTSPEQLVKCVRDLEARGFLVRTDRQVPSGASYSRIFTVKAGEVTENG